MGIEFAACSRAKMTCPLTLHSMYNAVKLFQGIQRQSRASQ